MLTLEYFPFNNKNLNFKFYVWSKWFITPIYIYILSLVVHYIDDDFRIFFPFNNKNSNFKFYVWIKWFIIPIIINIYIYIYIYIHTHTHTFMVIN